MATKSDFKVEVPESITRSIKEPKIEKYKFKKEQVRPKNVLEEIGNQLLDQSKRKMQKPKESDAPQRQPTPQVRPEPAITEYNESQNLFDRNRQALENNKHLNFVRRVLIPESNPLALVSEDGQALETHRMAADVMEEGRLRGNWLVYPTVVERESGRLEKLNNEDARTYAVSKGEYINFGTSKDTALDFSKNYKSASPEFNNYFKDRWETRQAEQVKEPTPEIVPARSQVSVFNKVKETIDNIDLRLPLNVRQLTYDVMGGDDPITQTDLKKNEYESLKSAALNAISRGSKIIEYEDYKTHSEGSQYADVGGGGSNKNFMSLLDNPSYSVKTTIGQANITINKDGEVIIKDRYNFNNAPEKFKFIDFVKGIKNSGLSGYAQARNVGTYFGSKPGEGSIVEINLGKLNEEETLKLQNLIASGGGG
jgi:hypothetical protein